MLDLNFVYVDNTNPRQVTYENELGKVWMSSKHNGDIANIAMNSYSAVTIKQNDSIFIAEPICVLPKNYDVGFLNRFRFVFTWATKVFENTNIANKVKYVNFPSYRNNPKFDKASWPSWNERADEIVFIANNKSSRHPSELYSLRINLADWLHKNSQFKVSWYGNMPIPRPYYRGKLQDKMTVLRKAKFHVCMENSYDPVYSAFFLTEKLPDAWLAGTIPIYMGCSNLDELGVSKDCYIDLLPFRFNFDGLESKLKNFSESNYVNMTQQYFKLSDDMRKLTSYENMFDIMLQNYA